MSAAPLACLDRRCARVRVALSQLQLPHLRDFVAELAANKQVAGYLAHRRMPRNAPWDGGYATFKPGRTVLQAKDEL